MTQPPRPAPRFIPTLTEVVQAPQAAGPAPVQPAPMQGETARGETVRTPAASGLPALAPGEREEEIVHRVMQRVDVSLESRLREAIAAVVQEQTRGVAQRLREEIESVVRQSVYEAVAGEPAADAARPRG